VASPAWQPRDYRTRMAETTVRDALLRAISDTGVSPAEIAVAIGAHPDTIARWIAGRSNPPERKVHDAIVWMGRDPVDYGLRKRSVGVAPLTDAERPPAWYRNAQDTTHAKLDTLLAQQERILRILETTR
jgi:hypothetical protein